MTENPLPKPSVKVPLSGKTGDWTAAEVRAIFCNPIYIGHPFSEEDWVKHAIRMIKEEGREQFLVNLLTVLRETVVLARASEAPKYSGPAPYGFSEVLIGGEVPKFGPFARQ